jgi:hypothetical protein
MSAQPSRPRRARRALAWFAAFVVLTVLLVVARHGEVGLWDWDTYGRLGFIRGYRPDLYLDGHLLYHGAMRALMAVGASPRAAVAWLTAGGAAAFVLGVVGVARGAGLAPRETALVVAAATLGSPGLVALFLIAEDNVLYLPLVLGVFALLARPSGDPAAERRRGVWLGLLLAAAMLVNVSLLVLVFPLAVAPWLLRRDRARAGGLVLAAFTALAAYHVAHVFPFTRALNALHVFLPQALRLQDFAQSTTPLGSVARLEQYVGGLRAVALTPSIHWMRPPPAFEQALRTGLPALLGGLGLALVIQLVAAHGRALFAALRARPEFAAALLVSLVFPYLYEPALIERWDIVWIGGLVGLVHVLRARPSRAIVATIVAMLSIGALGTGVTVAHHYGRVWADPAFVEARASAARASRGARGAVVVAAGLTPILLADLATRVAPRTVYVVHDAAGGPRCTRLVLLDEVPVPLMEVRDAVARGASLDPRLSAPLRRAIGR